MGAATASLLLPGVLLGVTDDPSRPVAGTGRFFRNRRSAARRVSRATLLSTDARWAAARERAASLAAASLAAATLAALATAVTAADTAAGVAAAGELPLVATGAGDGEEEPVDGG